MADHRPKDHTRASDHGHAHTIIVTQGPHRCCVRRAITTGTTAAFLCGPTVVDSTLSAIDLFPRLRAVAAYIADPDRTGERIGRQAERIAQAQCPHAAFGARHAHEGIVRRYCTIAFHAQQLAERSREVLRVGRAVVLTDRKIDAPIAAKRKATTVVAQLCGHGTFPHKALAAGHKAIARHGVAHDAVLRIRCGAIAVQVLCDGEVTGYCQRHQPALAVGGVARDLRQLGRQQHAANDKLDAAVAFADQHTPITQAHHCGGLVK